MTLKEEKQNLLAMLEEIRERDYIKASEKTTGQLNELWTDIDNDFFTVVVLGEFKRGKSTFINALLQKELLPVDVLPETATINALIYNDVPKAYVTLNDGTEKEGEATQEYLQQFSARNAAAGVQNIKYIKIGYPADILQNRLVIVDTPGVSDINEQRCEVTYRFIPKANAVLFLLDANSPLKKTEKDFIEQRLLPLGIDNIVFVVNKYDSVDEEEEPNYLQDLRLRLAKAFEMDSDDKKLKALKLYPLSAKWALQGILQNKPNFIEASGIEQLKAEILNLTFNGSVEAEKIKRYKIRLKNILFELYGKLENERAIKSAGIDKLKEVKHELDNLLSQYESSKGNIAEYVNNEKKNIRAMVDKSLHYFYNRLEENVVDNIALYKGLDFKEYVEQRISRTLQREMEGWVAAYSPHIEQLLKTLERELARGISYKFHQKVRLAANVPGNIQQNRFIFNLSAVDVSDSTIKAGAIAAGGAGLMMMIGGPVLMPFISMAAFPFLQKKLLEQKLAKAKDEVIPAVQEQMAQAIYNLKMAIYDYIEQRTAIIIGNTESAYEKILFDLKRDIEAQIKEKDSNSTELLSEVNRISKNITELKAYMEQC